MKEYDEGLALPPMGAEEYEQELAHLRARLEQAQAESQQLEKKLARLNEDLMLARQHEKQLEVTLNDVTGSTCWRMTWPLRYIISKGHQLLHTLPLLSTLCTLLACWRQQGFAGVRRHWADRRYYNAHFPGRSLPASSFAPVELLVRQSRNQPAGPCISIVVPMYNTPLGFLTGLIDSVRNQTYQNWQLVLADAGDEGEAGAYARARAGEDSRILYHKLEQNFGIAGNTNRGFELAAGEYIALLDHDDLLHPTALWYVAQQIVQKGADFIYTDELTFEGKPDNVVLYHFKPDFQLDNLRSNNYICHFTVFRASLLATAGGGERSEYNGSQDYDLILRLTEKAACIAHVPHALYYWRSSPTSVASDISAKRYAIDAAIKALYAHYKRVGVQVDKVEAIPNTPGFYKTDYTIADPARVSILIPTCDHVRDLHKCIQSIYAKTTYPDFEVILIENNSKSPETFRYYEQLQKAYPHNLRVVRWQGSGFNYSALNNFGAQYATGQYLLLLNNDTEVITPDWLQEMVMYAQQPRVGCVGAKLLYPDDTVQHAGVALGYLSLAAHMHKNFPVAHPGYMGRLVYAQDCYVVTAACLMVRKDVYMQVGGLDESFAVAFNDVDFCVRVRKAGYTNVFTPHAQLYHYESKSRGLDEAPEKRARFVAEVERFQQRWKAELAAGDPCMNPNIDPDYDDFRFKILPLQ